MKVTLNVKSAFGEAEKVDEILNKNEKLFEKISDFIEKTKTNTEINNNKDITEEIEVKKEDKEFEY